MQHFINVELEAISEQKTRLLDVSDTRLAAIAAEYNNIIHYIYR